MSEFSIAYNQYPTLDVKRVFDPEFLNLPGIVPHLPLVLFSAIFYQFINTILVPLLLHFKPDNPKVPPTELSRFYWNINTVSIAQSTKSREFRPCYLHTCAHGVQRLFDATGKDFGIPLGNCRCTCNFYRLFLLPSGSVLGS